MGLDQRYHQEWAILSRYIRELFNHHCARCEANCRHPESQEFSLQVHHIDENPRNNVIGNLIPLCARCHLQIEKEARVHAPQHKKQTELFEETYMSQMEKMRKSALQKFSKNSISSMANLTEEAYEENTMMFDD